MCFPKSKSIICVWLTLRDMSSSHFPFYEDNNGMFKKKGSNLKVDQISSFMPNSD